MTRDHLEQHLDRGAQLGFKKPTDCDAFLGWILLEKQKTDDRLLDRLGDKAPARLVSEQTRIRSTPYTVRVIELPREVHESEDYECPGDYRVNDRHYFAALDEVELFLQNFRLSLKDIRWRSDIDAP